MPSATTNTPRFALTFASKLSSFPDRIIPTSERAAYFKRSIFYFAAAEMKYAATASTATRTTRAAHMGMPVFVVTGAATGAGGGVGGGVAGRAAGVGALAAAAAGDGRAGAAGGAAGFGVGGAAAGGNGVGLSVVTGMDGTRLVGSPAGAGGAAGAAGFGGGAAAGAAAGFAAGARSA
jgi:hypothetical protein